MSAPHCLQVGISVIGKSVRTLCPQASQTTDILFPVRMIDPIELCYNWPMEGKE